MSLLSQSRVREEEHFKTAYDTLDCVMLWALIRRTHLTHMYGGDETLQEYNQHEQESEYGSMRQGEREHIVTFKNRFDEQVSANAAVGIAAVTESKRALDFLGKLDTRRSKVMLDDMKYDALRRKLGAFPTTLALAFHIASEWNDRVPASTPTPAPAGANAAYVTEGVHVTAAKDSEKKTGKAGGGSKKSLADIECYKCETMGHWARNCPQKKSSSSEKFHVTVAESDEEYEGESSEWGADKICCFSRFDVLLNNEASLNIFNNGVDNSSEWNPIRRKGERRSTRGVRGIRHGVL